MPLHQIGRELLEPARGGVRVPFLDAFCRMDGAQKVDDGGEPRAVLDQIAIGAHEIGRAGRDGGGDLDPRRGLHRLPEARRQPDLADLARFRLDHHRLRRIEPGQRHGEAAFEAALRGLTARQGAEERAAVIGEPLEIEDLHAEGGQMRQDLGLRGPGVSVDHHHGRPDRPVVELLHHEAAPALVAAFQHLDPPADLAEDHGEGVRPLPAAPAVDERAPAARTVGQNLLDVTRGIAGHQRRADLAGREGVDLLVDRSDPGALLIVEDGQVDRSGHAVLLPFGRRAHVDHIVEPVLDELRKVGCTIGHAPS